MSELLMNSVTYEIYLPILPFLSKGSVVHIKNTKRQQYRG